MLPRGADTPPVGNAIEVVEGRRGFSGLNLGTVLVSDPAARMVGFAVTARLRALRSAEKGAGTVRARRMDYDRMVAGAPRPSVVVIEDEDGADGNGAFWGEIDATVDKGPGCFGAVTDGVMRDPKRFARDQTHASRSCFSF